MDQAKKRQIKKYASWIGITALVILLTVMPLLAGNETVTDGPQASVLSGTVERGSVSAELGGGGVLAAPDRTEINLPSGVKIREFLVKNGDLVEEGTPLVLVDRVSVMSAITSVQETMDHLTEQMNEAEEEEAPDEIISLTGGRVKQVFAQEGERVQDVMLRDGALAVLSLDGLMALRLEVDCPLSTGSAVSVVFPDGTEAEGRIESNLDGIVIVTVEDDGYAIGETVQVTETGGTPIGSGELYVHNPWHAVAYTGIIDSVRIEPEETVDDEEILFTLSDTTYTAQRDSLAVQHREYEDLMLRLFRMYQSETIDAPCAGLVSGIEEDSIHLLSASGSGIVLELLVNAPNGDDETAYLNFVGIVTGTEMGVWNLSLNLTPHSIVDYQDLSGLELDPAQMTQPVLFVPTVPVYELAEGQWVQIEPAAVVAGDFLLIAMDYTANPVWVVRITEENRTPQIPDETQPTVPPTQPEAPEPPTVPDMPVVTEPPVTDPDLPEDATTPTDPSVPDGVTEPSEPSTDPTIPTMPSIPGFQYPDLTIPDNYGDIFGNYGSYGSFGDYGSFGGAVTEEPEFELFDLEGDTLITLTGQETVTLEITLDEQDISSITMGQMAQVRVEAIPNELFPAVITSIGTKGTNNGGSSKFTAELTLDKTAGMLPGMSAAASIPLSAVEDVPVIPLAALVEQGANTLVYTGYDSENQILTDPVIVTTGLSDGTSVQILSGLEIGDTFWYAYYDTLELSTEVDTQRSPFG